MLILSRYIGEAIMIGHDVKVVVQEIRGKQVRLAIVASPDVPVFREEIYKRIKQEQVSVPP